MEMSTVIRVYVVYIHNNALQLIYLCIDLCLGQIDVCWLIIALYNGYPYVKMPYPDFNVTYPKVRMSFECR